MIDKNHNKSCGFFIEIIMQKKLIVIGGPTASGKTTLAIQLATYFKTEIISADSRQFYRELTIGTAKPTNEELSQAKHHFINSHSINEHINAGTYSIEAQKILNNIFQINDVAILVGGSGLFINALIYGLDNLPKVEEPIRQTLKDEFKTIGLDSLLAELKNKDPDYYEKVDQQNHQRVMRALEIIRTTGNPYSSYLGKNENTNAYEVSSFVIDYSRDKLYHRINKRVDSMMDQGFLEEVKSLVSYRQHSALQTVGYKELFEYLDGTMSLDEAIDLIKQHTRNYAKRQLTWFRHQGDFHFLVEEKSKNIYKQIIEKVK